MRLGMIPVCSSPFSAEAGRETRPQCLARPCSSPPCTDCPARRNIPTSQRRHSGTGLSPSTTWWGHRKLLTPTDRDLTQSTTVTLSNWWCVNIKTVSNLFQSFLLYTLVYTENIILWNNSENWKLWKYPEIFLSLPGWPCEILVVTTECLSQWLHYNQQVITLMSILP